MTSTHLLGRVHSYGGFQPNPNTHGRTAIMRKSSKQEITRESIISAIGNGAKSLTQVAHAHGHVGSVSSTVAARIRTLVPEVAQRMAGTYVEPKPAVQVSQRKGVYRGLYGAVFSRAVAAGEVPKRATAEIAADPACTAAIQRIKERNPDSDLIVKLGQAVTYALGVVATSKHQSNMGRSKNVSETRGAMRIVAIS